jgi:hypothetical protein
MQISCYWVRKEKRGMSLSWHAVIEALREASPVLDSRDGHRTQGIRGGFCEVQQVNSMPLLSSYNCFACLQLDTLIQPEICNNESKEVIHHISHPPIPNQCSHLPDWEYQLPGKYVIASSPGSMSLSVNIEIGVTDTGVKWCVQALVDCRAMGCFIDIGWSKLNNVPTCPLTNPILVYNVNGTANEAGMITEIADLVLHHDSHPECTQFVVTHLGKQSIILATTSCAITIWRSIGNQGSHDVS